MKTEPNLEITRKRLREILKSKKELTCIKTMTTAKKRQIEEKNYLLNKYTGLTGFMQSRLE